MHNTVDLMMTKLMQFGHHDFIDDASASYCDSNNAFCENSLLFHLNRQWEYF